MAVRTMEINKKPHAHRSSQLTTRSLNHNNLRLQPDAFDDRENDRDLGTLHAKIGKLKLVVAVPVSWPPRLAVTSQVSSLRTP